MREPVFVRILLLPSGERVREYYANEHMHRYINDESMIIQDLSVCPRCESDLVHLTSITQVSLLHWEVELRCANCRWEHWGTYDLTTMEYFHHQLLMGNKELQTELQQLHPARLDIHIQALLAAHDS